MSDPVTGNSTTLTLTPEDAKIISHYLRKGAMEEAAWMDDFPNDYTKEQREEAAKTQARAVGYAEFLVMSREPD